MCFELRYLLTVLKLIMQKIGLTTRRVFLADQLITTNKIALI